jgi:hydroxymethylglutaryl-CoA reductase (NADPH)
MKTAQDFIDKHGQTVVVSTSVFVICSFINAVMSKKDASNDSKIRKGPQPKWAYFKVLNYVVMSIFVGSVTYAGLNYRKITAQVIHNSGDESILLTSFLFPFMILWTLCLAYFFGFFGISLVDTEALGDSPSSFGLADLQKEAEAASGSKAAAASTHQARNDAPICNPEPSKNLPRTIPNVAPSNDDEEIDYPNMTDEDVLETLLSGKLKDYQLEKKLGDYERAVYLRRQLYENILDKKLDLIPFTGYDYNKVFGANCEIVIGYVPIPCGVVGPITINSEPVYIPMATTEGCLVASTNRGCKAISASGGCNSILLKDAITRAPCVRFPSAMRAAALKKYVSAEENYQKLEKAFNSTTNYGKLQSCEVTCAGRNAYLRFCCMSGDAMGMNMVSKGCLAAIDVLEHEFPDMVLVAISGNMCTDKKPSAINWILGRGKSVIVEAVIPDLIVKTVLKSSVHDMIETNKQKNHIGSAMAGSIGGFNAHAANIVTAVFLATGQDPAQNVESSNCLTIMEYAEDGESLHVSVTMPSIEVGTVGGGTSLPAQAGCLEICGVRGAAKGENSSPGDNSRKLAMIVGAATLAGELSLIAALAANHLVRSHMQHNRKPQTDSDGAAVASMKKNASMPELQNRKYKSSKS